MPAIQFGTQTIEYDLILMPRKTLGITVHPDLSVTVKAPEDTVLAQIEAKLKQRAAWIL